MDYVKIDVIKCGETAKGCWVKPDEGEEEKFVAYKLMGRLSDRPAEGAANGDGITLYLPDWIVDKYDWEGFSYE